MFVNFGEKEAVHSLGIIGEQEMNDGTIAVKDMATGEQKQMNVEELKKLLA